MGSAYNPEFYKESKSVTEQLLRKVNRVCYENGIQPLSYEHILKQAEVAQPSTGENGKSQNNNGISGYYC